MNLLKVEIKNIVPVMFLEIYVSYIIFIFLKCQGIKYSAFKNMELGILCKFSALKEKKTGEHECIKTEKTMTKKYNTSHWLCLVSLYMFIFYETNKIVQSFFNLNKSKNCRI